MAYTAIDDPEAYFQAKIYSGTGSSQAITFDGDTDMQPDFFWFKNRGGNYHVLGDSVRGITKFIYSNDTSVEVTNTTVVSSLNSDGYTLGDNSNTSERVNTSGDSMVSWNWKESATAGFDIVTYTGTGSNTTISHSLSAVPSTVWIKARNATEGWSVYHIGLTSAAYYIQLDGTAAEENNDQHFQSTAPTSSVFSIGTSGRVNAGSQTQVAYCFAPKQGFSKFGSYAGNGSATSGAFIYTGFRPACVMVRLKASGQNWLMWDNKRNAFNAVNKVIYATTADGETADGADGTLDFLSNGFKLYSDFGSRNGDGSSYIFHAWAEAPFVNSNGVPNNAR